MIDSRNNVISTLFHAHRKDVTRFLRKRLFRREDVEDMVQETFLRAMGNTDWEQTGNPRAYLLRIADNLFKDRVRKDRRGPAEQEGKISFDDITLMDVESGLPSPEKITAARQEYQSLCKAIARLPFQTRNAVVLHKFLNLTYTEVARSMGISASTVEKHIARGMLQCSDYLRSLEGRLQDHSVLSEKNSVTPISIQKNGNKPEDIT